MSRAGLPYGPHSEQPLVRSLEFWCWLFLNLPDSKQAPSEGLGLPVLSPLSVLLEREGGMLNDF